MPLPTPFTFFFLPLLVLPASSPAKTSSWALVRVEMHVGGLSGKSPVLVCPVSRPEELHSRLRLETPLGPGAGRKRYLKRFLSLHAAIGAPRDHLAMRRTDGQRTRELAGLVTSHAELKL